MKRVMWKRACAAVQGRSHVNSLTPCQDSVSTTYRRNVNAIALSDGAGSARHSHIGSKTCAYTLCAILCRHFDEVWHLERDDARAKISRTIREQLAEKAVNLNVEQSDLAATALAVAVKKNNFIAVHLGDGAIGMELTDADGTKKLETLSSPDNGEHSNETFFVTSSSAIEHMRMYTGSIASYRNMAITGFILMSDGPEAALYRKADNTLAPACIKLLESARQLKKKELNTGLKNTLKLIADKKTHDDCSIALMAHV